MSSSVRIELRGGLGNQLFQYYAGAFLALKYDSQLEVDFTHLFNNHENHVLNSVNEGNDFLKILNLPGKRILQSRNSFQIEKVTRKALNQTKYFKNHLLAPKMFIKSYEPKTPGFDPKFGDRNFRRVGGYFQTYRYFDQVIKIDSDYFPHLHQPSNWFLESLKKIQEPTTVVVHLREHYPWLRGTFVQCGKDYYEKALRVLEKELDSFKIVIFSTPNLDIRSYLPPRALQNFEFLSQPESSPDVESLILMSKSRALVTANSTFSWWAGKLATEKQLVIAPHEIYVNKPNPTDYYPKNWITI
jgi:hypothetical protein